MKKLGIFLFVVVVMGMVLLNKNDKPNTLVVVNPTVIPTTTIAPTAVVEYSAEVKTKVRSDFINNCKTKGHYTTVECNCAADYLSKNYSEAELAKIYIQYHATNQVPAALKAAAEVCTKK